MSKEIEVRVSISIIENMPPRLAGLHLNQVVIEKLREAGVPVKGKYFSDGVERGKLLKFEDSTDFVFKWIPGEVLDTAPPIC